jgi:hypothetical protein
MARKYFARPVNTYFAARDGDGFHPALGTSRTAEQASASGEQRRAIAGYALRLAP